MHSSVGPAVQFPRRELVILWNFLLVVLLPSIATPQSSGGWQPRVAVAVLSGTSSGDVVMIEPGGLRSPPVVVALDDSEALAVAGLDARVYWTPHTSTFIQFERSGERRWHFTYPRPDILSLPFTHYEAERDVRHRNSTLTLGQSVELLTRGRLRPWIGGAVAIRRVEERQDRVSIGFYDPSLRSEGTFEWSRRQIAASIAGGARAYLAGRLFVGGELALAFWGTGSCVLPCGSRSPRDRGFQHFLTARAAAGVAF